MEIAEAWRICADVQTRGLCISVQPRLPQNSSGIAGGPRIPFGEIELVVAGLPVCAGRLVRHLGDFFTGLNGNPAPAVAVVLHENREYNGASIEWKIRLQERGFTVRSAAALIGGHGAGAKTATGRPDANDLAVAGHSGARRAEFVREDISGKLELRGNYPFTWRGWILKIPAIPLLVPGRLRTNPAPSAGRAAGITCGGQ